MIKFSRYFNSPDCYYVLFVDSLTRKEKEIHVHISEIRRFYGERPNAPRIFNNTELTEFFRFKLDQLGANGEYHEKKAKNNVRLLAPRRRSKPNSPGEGVE